MWAGNKYFSIVFPINTRYKFLCTCNAVWVHITCMQFVKASTSYFLFCSLCKTGILNSNITLKQLAFTKNLYLATNNYYYREVNFSKTSKWKADILNNFVFPKVPNTDLVAYVYWFFVSQVPSNKCIAPLPSSHHLVVVTPQSGGSPPLMKILHLGNPDMYGTKSLAIVPACTVTWYLYNESSSE